MMGSTILVYFAYYPRSYESFLYALLRYRFPIGRLLYRMAIGFRQIRILIELLLPNHVIHLSVLVFHDVYDIDKFG